MISSCVIFVINTLEVEYTSTSTCSQTFPNLATSAGFWASNSIGLEIPYCHSPCGCNSGSLTSHRHAVANSLPSAQTSSIQPQFGQRTERKPSGPSPNAEHRSA